MAPILGIAAIGAAATTAATAAATGEASAAVHLFAPGLKVALTHVQSWSHAYQILTQHLSALGENGVGGIGTGMKAFARGLAHGR